MNTYGEGAGKLLWYWLSGTASKLEYNMYSYFFNATSKDSPAALNIPMEMYSCSGGTDTSIPDK